MRRRDYVSHMTVSTNAYLGMLHVLSRSSPKCSVFVHIAIRGEGRKMYKIIKAGQCQIFHKSEVKQGGL